MLTNRGRTKGRELLTVFSYEFSRNIFVLESTSSSVRTLKERMRMFSLTNVLRSAAVMLISLGPIVGATAGDAHQKYQYNGSPIVPAYANHDERQIRQVQVALRNLGYYSGAPDGFLGYKTDIAISRFQLERCHPVRPVVDQWLLVTLGIVRPLVD